ncbi:uncharacterized protein LOC131847882 [Achroia grisella]|uniref:uncharacterized protein LOC131847882 n=1 Tax=Achroia grisella TaxID=688607 RepID=UPI0027D31FCD|nr:uncharacterized protein LOC131847882 [Achroia grisella]
MDSGSSDLQDLMVKRSSIKGQITKFKNYIVSISCKEILTPLEFSELTIKLSRFESLSSRFDTLQNRIEVLNSSNLDSEIDERDDMEQLFVTNTAVAQSIIQKHQQNNHRDDSNYKDLNSTQMSSPAGQHELGFKIPHVQIAKYDGTYFRWLEFKDTFLSIIHNNERIAPIHKFYYLTSYLEGDAARVISNLEVSSNNYETAWNLLCERYDNKRQLIKHHLDSLLNLQNIVRESDKALRFLVDHVTKNLRALGNLGQPTDKWDILIIHIMSSKLDNNTLRKWEEWRGTLDDIPNLKQFSKFLIDRADVLESLSRSSTSNKFISLPKGSNSKFERPHIKSFACTNEVSAPSISCVICNGKHRIYDCTSFKAKDIEERINEVHKLKLCSNCLRSGHATRNCRLGPCRICKRRHNSLLHRSVTDVSTSSSPPQSSHNATDTIVNLANENVSQVLLSTALIEVVNPITLQKERVRALLDCGSQSSFMTNNLKNRLSLKSNSNQLVNVISVGNNVFNKVTETCVAQLKSLTKPFNVTLGFLILPEITGDLPKAKIDINNINLPNNVILADPNFNHPAPIEILIGADIFWDILGCEQHSLGPKHPKLRNSQFGWLISGPIYTNFCYKQASTQCHHTVTTKPDDNIHQELTKFWEIEEVSLKSLLSEEEKACERHFLSHTTRLNTGRFCVHLPVKDSPDCLGESYTLAKRRLVSLERKFRKQSSLKTQYIEFMREYSELGHLSECTLTEYDEAYFLCHHAVFKDTSESTKIRVVFDGSAPSSSGQSINDLLMVGPNMQDTLFSILIRARQHKYLLTGDVEKMYRQIQVAKRDRKFQLVLWREDESEPIKAYELNTVTYGMASSSYLSTRCLWQLGEESPDKKVKTIIQRDFYIDDLITGAENEHDLRYIHKAVSEVLQKGCFNLRKFKTNLPSIVQNNSNNDDLSFSESTSTLGIGWNPPTDTLHFPIKFPCSVETANLSKRAVLSSIFRIFDPLGLLSPCVVRAKIILQQIWLLKVGWDEPVPDNIQMEWNGSCHYRGGVRRGRG